MKYIFKKGERVVFDIGELNKIFTVDMSHLVGLDYVVLEDYSSEDHGFVELRSSLGKKIRVSGYAVPALVLIEPTSITKKLTIKEKLTGCAFKGTILKNCRGTKNQAFYKEFSDKEFFVKSLSGKYVYGYPEGYYGQDKFLMQFDAHEVRFYHEDQTSPDAAPNLTIIDMINHIDLEQVKNT